jgi:N-acetylglucosaminyldiphosphoundecaprenol N-acetyl-beta-D-mannosaminyltransferase
MTKFLLSSNNMKFPVFTGNLNEIPSDSKKVISTINQYSYCIAEKDVDFSEALKHSDILLPDGISIVLATRWLTDIKVKKIAGADLHQFLLGYYDEKGGSCFYLGSSQVTLDRIRTRVTIEYPHLRINSYSPPYKSRFSDDDNDKIVNAINKFRPDVLFIGMTAPKQEKWAYSFKDALDVKEICSIGAVFDFYAGTVARPDKFWIKIGLEWLLRLIKEPKRLWKRYIFYGPVFVYLIFKEKFVQVIYH